MNDILKSIRKDYRKIFVLDGLGAIVSAICLLIVLPSFDELKEVPKGIFHLLGSLPIIFFIIDLIAFFSYPVRRVSFLMLLMILNFLYCLFSVFMTIEILSFVSFLWCGYVIVEVIVILIVILLEWKIYKEWKIDCFEAA